MTLSAGRITSWARALWPCSYSKHARIITLEGHCGACGRVTKGSGLERQMLLKNIERASVQGEWYYDGDLVALVKGGTLFVIQDNYERAVRTPIADAGEELIESMEEMRKGNSSRW